MPEIQTFLRSEWAKSERELADNARLRRERLAVESAAEEARMAAEIKAKQDAFPLLAYMFGCMLYAVCGFVGGGILFFFLGLFFNGAPRIDEAWTAAKIGSFVCGLLTAFVTIYMVLDQYSSIADDVRNGITRAREGTP